MDIVIDFWLIVDYFNQPPHIILWRLFLLFGLIPMSIMFLWMVYQRWLHYTRVKWFSAFKFVLLALFLITDKLTLNIGT